MHFARKTRWVKDGHLTPDLENSKYTGVVSRESVQIALTYAALHRIIVLAVDIRNACVQTSTSESIISFVVMNLELRTLATEPSLSKLYMAIRLPEETSGTTYTAAWSLWDSNSKEGWIISIRVRSPLH